jgi:hypothetical protein
MDDGKRIAKYLSKRLGRCYSKPLLLLLLLSFFLSFLLFKDHRSLMEKRLDKSNRMNDPLIGYRKGRTRKT